MSKSRLLHPGFEENLKVVKAERGSRRGYPFGDDSVLKAINASHYKSGKRKRTLHTPMLR
jgi:hypothetical protein